MASEEASSPQPQQPPQPSTPTPSGGVYNCDVCAKVVFDSYEDLLAHVESKHGSIIMPERADLQRMADKIRPVLPDLLQNHKERWMRWGRRTFDVAARRDAGPERLAEACAARRQLELVVQQWRPQAKVFIFGSSVVMGLWDGLSDIDFTVVDIDAMEKGEWPPNEKTGVRSLTQLLRNAGFSYNNLEPIEHARVPIIKHSASVATYRFVKERYEKIISRSVRVLLESAATPEERKKFEVGVKEVIGSAPEHLWWDRSGRIVGMTLKDNLDALKILLHPPSPTSNNRVLRRAPLHSEMRPDLFRIDFDLSFRTFGIKNSHLLRNFLTAEPCGRPGAIVLKDWSKASGVNNSINGFLTSYAINILWIYFLFRKGIVPYCDPASIPESLAGNTQYDPTYMPLIPEELKSEEGQQMLYTRMGELLVGFFSFYVYEFDWDNHVVSLNRSEITTKAQLQWTEADEVRLSKKGKNVHYLMAIEDPYEDNLNLGRHMGHTRVRKVKSEFQRALISLVKDEGNETCVFAPEAKDTKRDQDPPIEDVTTLMAIAVEVVERAKDTVSESTLRAAFVEKAKDPFVRVSEFWSWKELVRRLGYKLAGDIVVPFRGLPRRNPTSAAPVSKPAPAEVSGGEAKKDNAGASQGQASAAVSEKVDLVEKLVEDFVTEQAKAAPQVLPEWVVWSSPPRGTGRYRNPDEQVPIMPTPSQQQAPPAASVSSDAAKPASMRVPPSQAVPCSGISAASVIRQLNRSPAAVLPSAATALRAFARRV